jgi:hypothetical protein
VTHFTARRAALSVAILAAAAIALTGVAPAQAGIATKAPPIAQTTHSVQNQQSEPRIAREWAAAWNSSDTTGEIFGRSAAFLKLAAARATPPAETLAAPGQLSETSRSASDGR